MTCLDAFSARGRKPAEGHLPRLLDDIREIVHDQRQTDPTFQTDRLYCRIRAAEVRRQLIDRKGYTEEQLPTQQTITTKLNPLGFRLTKVAKCRPQKKMKETDAIFAQLKQVNPEADRADDILRLSLDAKATVPIGPFARRGYSRTRTRGADHDFKPEGKLTPFGIFRPQTDDLWFYMAYSKDDQRLHRGPPGAVVAGGAAPGPPSEDAAADLDNGPENHSRRTQFL